MGKSRMDRSSSGTITARFLRCPDRKRVFKGTGYKMFEDIPKNDINYKKTENGQTEAGKEGWKARFLNGRYVKL